MFCTIVTIEANASALPVDVEQLYSAALVLVEFLMLLLLAITYDMATSNKIQELPVYIVHQPDFVDVEPVEAYDDASDVLGEDDSYVHDEERLGPELFKQLLSLELAAGFSQLREHGPGSVATLTASVAEVAIELSSDTSLTQSASLSSIASDASLFSPDVIDSSAALLELARSTPLRDDSTASIVSFQMMGDTVPDVLHAALPASSSTSSPASSATPSLPALSPTASGSLDDPFSHSPLATDEPFKWELEDCMDWSVISEDESFPALRKHQYETDAARLPFSPTLIRFFGRIPVVFECDSDADDIFIAGRRTRARPAAPGPSAAQPNFQSRSPIGPRSSSTPPGSPRPAAPRPSAAQPNFQSRIPIIRRPSLTPPGSPPSSQC